MAKSTFDVVDADTQVLINFDPATGEIMPCEKWSAAVNTQRSYERLAGRPARIRLHVDGRILAQIDPAAAIGGMRVELFRCDHRHISRVVAR